VRSKQTFIPAIGITLACALWANTAQAAAQEACYLIDNFTQVLPGNNQISCSVETAAPKAGLGSALLTYQMDPKQRKATLNFQDGYRAIPTAGMLKLWVRGDGSGTEMEFSFRHAKTRVDNEGRRQYYEHQNLNLPRVKLDFSDWKEITLDVRALPEGKVAWLERIDFHAARQDPKTNPEPKMTGTVAFDDLRLIPTGTKPGSAFQAGLIGSSVRELSKEVAYFADIRNFGSKSARVRARLTLLDRNGNKAAERDFPLELEGNTAKEFKLELEPENIESYLPPFMLSGDVLSTDLTEASAQIEQPIVMGNARLLVEDFSNVSGRWFTAGYEKPISSNQRNWVEWTHGEGQRGSVLLQNTATVSRVELKHAGEAPAGMPAVRSAMQIDFSGEAAVYNGADRYLPGQPYRIGFWVKGDGSNAKLSALLLDYTNGADFWAGGWKRIHNGEMPLCALDFTDWRYIEVDVPGRGIGVTSPRGSTDAIDFPFELTAFRIVPEAGKSGRVQIGPVFVRTQHPAVATLALQTGYDDPEFQYGADKNAWLTVQNGWLSGKRKVKAQWTLLDRKGEKIASGNAEAELPAGETKVFPLDLAKHAELCAQRPGPFRLDASLSDSADPSITATRQTILAKPDSTVLAADFENDRGYYGWKAGSKWTAQTSSEQAQSGKRALKIGWEKSAGAPVAVAIDPPLRGFPVQLAFSIFGDGSGVVVHPVIGGTTGVNHGANQNNFYLLRRDGLEEGGLQNGIKVDWSGWKTVSFHLPQIPSNWDTQSKVLPFIPTYPLGVHLFVDGRGCEKDTGQVFIDDVTVKTHLEPAERLAIALERSNESNINTSGLQTIAVSNAETGASRKASVVCEIRDWRNVKVDALEAQVELKAGETKRLATAKKLPPGCYTVHAELKDGSKILATQDDDLLVGDLAAHLGAEWPAALADEWKLRAPLKDTLEFLDEDWDWVEHYPGNLQTDSIRERSQRTITQGGSPYVLLGYGAYWSAGVGHEQMKAGAFQRRQRDIGHAVDIFLVPQRMEDWENYVSELMRGAGGDVHGWVLWDNPDSAGPMKVDAPKFAQMLQTTDKWRRAYCPKIPLLIGGMSRATAIPYLKQLSEQTPAKLAKSEKTANVLDSLGGVHVRLDVGRMSPEDAEIRTYVQELRDALITPGGTAKTILLSDLDWAVEKDPAGLSAFDQAAYLSRSAFMLDEVGIRPLLSIRNEDSVRLGLGLLHRRRVAAPPMTEMTQSHDFKPAWWSMVQTRRWLDDMKFAAAIDVQDVVPQRTTCLLYSRGEKSAAVIWRNDDLGAVNFARTGLSVESAQDVLATPVSESDGWYAAGRMPTVFVINASAAKAAVELRRLWLRDGTEAAWPQRVLASFTPSSAPSGYTQNGEAFTQAAQQLNGEKSEARGVKFKEGGREAFTVKIDAGSDLILRKAFILDESGQEADVKVNGQLAGVWNLRRSEAKLSSGVRSACFVIGRELLKGGDAAIEITYKTPANTLSWCALEYKQGGLPLSAVGALHADQNFGRMRFARNITGAKLKVGTTEFANGLGVFAQSLQEYALNKQFKRFKAQVGVDAVTEGRGSVVFEVYADGKKIWASGVMSGLDQPKVIDVDVSGADRLRLIVTDAGDGNKFDAGNWCEPELFR